MTMATCSVNLTNCDLAPRLSLCPDSGLLVGKSASITKYGAENHIMTNSLSLLIGSLTNISTRWWFLNGIILLSIIVNSIGCRNMCFHLSDISCIKIVLTPILRLVHRKVLQQHYFVPPLKELQPAGGQQPHPFHLSTSTFCPFYLSISISDHDTQR